MQKTFDESLLKGHILELNLGNEFKDAARHRYPDSQGDISDSVTPAMCLEINDSIIELTPILCESKEKHPNITSSRHYR